MVSVEWPNIESEQPTLSGGLMKKGDIVKFRKAVDPGDDDLRMILLEISAGRHPESAIISLAAILQI